MDVWNFAKQYLYPYKVKGSEIIPKLCPICQGGEKHDKETFALNADKRTYNCKRGSCGAQGHFKQLCEKFGEEADRDEYYIPKVKQYKKPATEIKLPTTQVEEYLKLRKISKETQQAYKIGCDTDGNIIFPFYENSELVFVKFRPARKVEKGERKAWRESDTKPILFGMDLCEIEYPLVITEGEIDAMSLYESGIHNVVSVPSGADDLTWLDTCWNWLKQFSTIVIFGDNDAPGIHMAREITKRLNSENIIKVVELPEGIKDANELLYRKGKEAVKTAYNNAKEVQIAGIIRLADVKPIDVKSIPRTLSNVRQLDIAMGGFLDGELTVWTGRRGEGKSTLLGQMMLEAVEQGKKVCAYSGELRADWFKYWIELQAAGPKYCKTYVDDLNEKEKIYVDEAAAIKIRQWYSDLFYMYDNEIATIKGEEITILKIFEYAAKRYGCKVFLVDNLMTANSQTTKDEDYFRAQSNFVGELVNFARIYNTHVHLVAHPRKSGRDLDCDDVSGIGDITNRAHNVISWSRLDDLEKAKHGADGILKILKNRSYGANATIGFRYDPISRRLFHKDSRADKAYGWEKLISNIEEEVELQCPF